MVVFCAPSHCRSLWQKVRMVQPQGCLGLHYIRKSWNSPPGESPFHPQESCSQPHLCPTRPLASASLTPRRRFHTLSEAFRQVVPPLPFLHLSFLHFFVHTLFTYTHTPLYESLYLCCVCVGGTASFSRHPFLSTFGAPRCSLHT